MLYMVCPTCNKFLGQKVIEYEKGKDNICKNPELSNEEREAALTKLLLNLKLKRYCCKMRMMSYKDEIEYIIPVSSNE